MTDTPVVPCTFWTRGISFIDPPILEGLLPDGGSVAFCPETNDHQSAKYPGTVAYRVYAEPFEGQSSGVFLGWVPGELCGWMTDHSLPQDGPFGGGHILQVKYEDGRAIGIEIELFADEKMPRQRSTRG